MASTSVMSRDAAWTTRNETWPVAGRDVVRGTSGTNVGPSDRAVSAALGGTMLRLGLARRTPGGTALAILGGGLLYRAVTGHCHLYEALGLDTASDRETAVGASDEAAEAVTAITIGKPADELGRLWRDPRTLTRIMSGVAEVTPAGDGLLHWKVRGLFGRDLEWDTRVAQDQPGGGQRWQSVQGARVPHEGEVSFRRAPGDRGTEVTLRVRFDPPGGAVGHTAAKLLGFGPRLFAERALHYFKALAETGEIPTTDRQPAARADTR